MEKGDNIDRRELKPDERQLFITWLNMPCQYKAMSEKEIAALGLEDTLESLAKIKTQNAFADNFRVSSSLLTQWRKEARESGEYRSRFKEWAKDLTPNVVGRLYSRIMKDGNASEIKLWKEFIEGEAEKFALDESLAKIIKNVKQDDESEKSEKEEKEEKSEKSEESEKSEKREKSEEDE